MAVSDAVVGNITAMYVGVIACIKAYGVLCGRSLGFGFIITVSTTVVGLILVAALTWDVSRKATYAFSRNGRPRHHRHHHDDHDDEMMMMMMCKGGICWHGVAVKNPASQIQFTLPHHHHHPL